MSAQFQKDEGLRMIAEKTIAEAAERDPLDLFPLRTSNLRIGFQYCSQEKMNKGKIVFADCEKVKEKFKEFMPYDFIITFYQPNTDGLSEEAMKRLMYHELHHIGITPDGAFNIVPHNLEDFRECIDRWGIDWIRE